jgi:hypothetical protein
MSQGIARQKSEKSVKASRRRRFPAARRTYPFDWSVDARAV